MNPLFVEAYQGLTSSPKHVPFSLLYSGRGSEIYEEITRLPEYYPVNAELDILINRGNEIVENFPSDCIIVELGCGSASKTKYLLRAFAQRHGRCHFVGVDISSSALEFAAEELRKFDDRIQFTPVCNGYFESFAQIRQLFPTEKLVVLYLGSSLGNFSIDESIVFLNRIKTDLRCEMLLLAVDLWKSRDILYPAYHDSQGVTESFILNVIPVLNEGLGFTLALEDFEYIVDVNETAHHVAMFISPKRDIVQPFTKEDGQQGSITFTAGELIHVENSHKYTVEEIEHITHSLSMTLEATISSGIWSFFLLK